ncbi:unnamed protein product [Thelazia callipaeda]|uniref:Intraflagellar transport protein 81 homolog n=1 Tax=Thelazia callipaeda TaxID=103827 RepID=A0A0N5D9N2_THECL|nr:unnamed protein product [Thelazia callipaeda]
MTATLNVILDALNSEPFKMNLNSISFDLISNEQMLQILSDVILWIENSSVIDIREEGADETALRIFNSLRVLNYQPPTDIEALRQEWRCGIVEGEKSTIYPILEWIFQNVNIVKERAYLAKYLTKIDVPGAFQDSEVVEFSNQVSSMMEEFKRVHWQVVEVRKDSLLMEDIRNDLKAMKAEKEQLKKRIDKLERKLGNIANIEYFLQLAEKCRLQSEQVEKIGHLQQEQLNTIIYDEQKLQRLNASLRELKKIGENIDPTDKIKALKEEIETNRYVVEEKLPKEIHAKEMIVENLKKTVEVSALNENDVAELREKIERLNEEIIELVKKRDYKDEKTDKLSIYRHQASAIQRKKAILVEKLQEAR